MNNKKAFEVYITQNIDCVYRFAYTYTKNRQDAEDVVNESVTKALKNIHTLKDRTYIKAWLYKIVARTAIEWLRKQKKYTPLTDDAAESIPFEADFSNVSFQSIVEKLDVDRREIIVLRFLEDMQIKDIATMLDLNENTVKSRLYSGLRILREEMEAEQ